MLQEFFFGFFQSANWHGENTLKPLEKLADLPWKYAKQNKTKADFYQDYTVNSDYVW